jgi:Uma2 family endonuclease
MSTLIAEPGAALPGATKSQIPFLENGDCLSRWEFERRYLLAPHLKKAELIEGVVFVPSPVRSTLHGAPHASLMGCLVQYSAETPGVTANADTTIRLDLDNEFQPDGMLLLDPRCGGQAVIETDGYVAGAPEFVAEISGSTASIDLHAKMRVYKRSRVREYCVWRTADIAIDWFVLREGEYVRLPADDSGVYRSEVFPGLWIDSTALLRGDLSAALNRVREGLASPEHKSFVAGLGPTSASVGPVA